MLDIVVPFEKYIFFKIIQSYKKTLSEKEWKSISVYVIFVLKLFEKIRKKSSCFCNPAISKLISMQFKHVIKHNLKFWLNTLNVMLDIVVPFKK